MRYAAVVTKEGKNTLATVPDAPGCQTFAEPGESIEQRIAEALQGWNGCAKSPLVLVVTL